jgi:hypothetical protein
VENVNRNNPFQRPVSFAYGIHPWTSLTVSSIMGREVRTKYSVKVKLHSCPCRDLHVDPDPDQPAVLQQFIPELFQCSPCLNINFMYFECMDIQTQYQSGVFHGSRTGIDRTRLGTVP